MPPLREPGQREEPAFGVVHLAAEYGSLARTGGLAEAVAGLAATQASRGLQVAVVIPLHRSVRREAPALERVGAPFDLQVGPRTETGVLYRLPAAPGAARVYCIEHAYFDRAGLYGEGGQDYPDNLERWSFFCRAALDRLPHIARMPCLLHCHDWHTALAPVYLRALGRALPFADRVRTVLTVHNAGFQGHFPPDHVALAGLPWEMFTWRELEWYGRLNLLKGGLACADRVTTVSPTHAHELRTPAGGFGLHEAFMALGDRFTGIINGIDQEAWNPATDPFISATYTAEELAGKARCKVALQRSCGLPQRKRIPLFAMTARLTHQKGLELITGEYSLFMLEAQFVFLGMGEPKYEALLKMYESRWPDRISVHLGYAERLEHRLMAGADIYLMPSLYEPCGLAQLRAERYGALPLVRRVGGLVDTVEDLETGFVFDEYTSEDLLRVARHVMDRYHDTAGWTRMVRNAMSRDFSWDRSADRYLDVYRLAFDLPAAA